MFVVIICMLPAMCLGQFAQRGGVEGVVTDSTGAALPGAKVTLFALEQKTTKETLSDSAGHYSFSEITAGTYQVAASHAGFAVAKSTVIAVNLGTNARFDLKLQIGAQTEEVSVDSSTAVMETGQVSLDTNLSEKQFEQLPLNGLV